MKDSNVALRSMLLALATGFSSAAMMAAAPQVLAAAPMAAMQFATPDKQERSHMFHPAEPIFSSYRRGFSVQLEHTFRLPSGNILTQGPSYSAEAHAVRRLSGYVGVPSFGLATLRGTWNPQRGPWQLSLSVSDPGRENLFTNLADLSAFDTNRLRLWPDRHWWFGLARSF